MNTSNWCWNTPDQRPAGVTIVAVICASNRTHWTNVLGDQHGSQLYLTFCFIRHDICCKSRKCAWVFFGLIQCTPKGAKNTDDAWHSAVGTLLSPCLNLDLTGADLKWNFIDGFFSLCYMHLTVWIGDYNEHIMVA